MTVVIVMVMIGFVLVTSCGSENSTDTSSTEPISPGSADYCPPEDDGLGRSLDVSTLVGMDEDEAKQMADEYGCELFVVNRDGEPGDTPLPSNTLIEAHVENGEVTAARSHIAILEGAK